MRPALKEALSLGGVIVCALVIARCISEADASSTTWRGGRRTSVRPNDWSADGGDAGGADAAADGGDAAADGGDAYVNDLSIDIDGVDEYLSVSDSAELEPGAAWSFCAWLKEDTLASSDGILSKFATGQQAVKIRKSTTVKFRIDLHTTSNFCQSTNNQSISNGVWYFLCFVYNGGGATDADKVHHYVNATDGVLTCGGTLPTSINNTTSDWDIGNGSTGAFGPGNIDEVTMWNTNLSQGQVTTLYNSGHPAKPSTTNLVGYYHMGEWETFPTALDDTITTQSNGTYTNMESGDIVNDVP